MATKKTDSNVNVTVKAVAADPSKEAIKAIKSELIERLSIEKLYNMASEFNTRAKAKDLGYRVSKSVGLFKVAYSVNEKTGKVTLAEDGLTIFKIEDSVFYLRYKGIAFLWNGSSFSEVRASEKFSDRANSTYSAVCSEAVAYAKALGIESMNVVKKIEQVKYVLAGRIASAIVNNGFDFREFLAEKKEARKKSA